MTIDLQDSHFMPRSDSTARVDPIGPPATPSPDEKPRPLRIGVDGSLFTQSPRGHTIYALRLCQELSAAIQDAEFLMYAPRPVPIEELGRRWTMRVGGGRFASSPVLWLKLFAGRMVRRDNLDVFWSPYSFFPSLPIALPSILTIYDFVAESSPESFHPLHRAAFRRWLKRDVQRANEILTISHSVQNEIRTRFDREATVIAPGLDRRFREVSRPEREPVLAKYGLEQPYILSVAAWDPRKNIELLLSTYLGLLRDRAIGPYELVLVGRPERSQTAIRSILGREVGERVRCLGYVDADDLPSLYSAASLFVFPSRYEGYGMPVVEALSCGTPVLASDIPSLREAGGDRCVYVEPTEAALRDGIRSMLERPATAMLPAPSPSWSVAGAALARRLRMLAKHPEAQGDPT